MVERVSEQFIDNIIKFATEQLGKLTDRDLSWYHNQGILNMATELRERRAAEKTKTTGIFAAWTTLECPKCSHTAVVLDQIGYRCLIDGCGWTKDDPLKMEGMLDG